MPKTIAPPQVGHIDAFPSEEIVKATMLQKRWDHQMLNLNSPNKGVIHHQPNIEPEFPKFPKIQLHQASILPMLGGKLNQIGHNLFINIPLKERYKNLVQ